VEKKIPQDWLAQFQALKLSRSELTKFLNIYKTIDRDKKGSITLQELLIFLQVEDTSFTNRAFSVFDSNGSGKVDFREFVLSLWNYCTLTKVTLDIFTFDLYDEDSSGELGLKEVVQMVEDLYGKKFKTNANAKQ
jgi:serine/threonine-protein phosphatase 2B regulatory subunit